MTTLNGIGILGFGYLGKALYRQFPWGEKSWATMTDIDDLTPASQVPSDNRLFRWHQPSTWVNIPEARQPVVLTIPPIHQDREQEKARLRQWCQWMKAHRPGIKSLVYISSTGVYPDEAGLWTEEMDFAPDTNKGGLRLDTEEILAQYFDLRIVRSGAIYGPDRHIGLRILSGKTIPKGQRPVHRIHVTDLAGIVLKAISERAFPPIVNAVDLDPAPSETVVSWLLQQGFPQFNKEKKILFKDGYYSRKQQGMTEKRFISNQLLIKKIGFQFQYPTYKEGLGDLAEF